MDVDIHWTPRFRRSLKAIVDYVTRTDPDAVGTVVELVSDKVELLATAPYLGWVVENRWNREVREILAGSYRIFYDVDPFMKRVTLIDLLHVRQQDPDFSE
jgi:plasmid stabilization system protein ParE